VRESQVRAETVAEQFTETGFPLEEITAGLPVDATANVGTRRSSNSNARFSASARLTWPR